MVSEEELDELRTICEAARPLTDGPLQLIHLKRLVIPMGNQEFLVSEALLCLSPHEGYMTRLFLSDKPPKALNWSIITVLGRAWHKWSWQGVSSDQRPAQILTQHLKAFR